MSGLCVVIPCFNESKRFKDDLVDEFLTRNSDTQFCLVNDGSTDNTLEVLNRLGEKWPAKIKVVDCKINKGKAEAIRQGVLGMLVNNFAYYAYLDADFSTSLEELMRMYKIAIDTGFPFVYGSRIKRLGALIDRNIWRHYVGRVFATFTSVILNLPVYDSQCGAKIIKADFASLAFNDSFFTKWLFDVEIFARLIKEYGHAFIVNNTIEVPLLKWEEREGTKIKFSNGLSVPFDLLRIKRKYKI